jgi:hypothetical protein
LLTDRERTVVERAREIISEEAWWTRGCEARKKNGEPCTWYDCYAVAYCASAALRSAAVDALDVGFGVADRVCRDIESKLYDFARCWLDDLNDDGGREYVIELFDDALAV